MDVSKLLTVSQAASYLGISPGRIRQWVVSGTLPRTKVLGRLVFTKDQLDKMKGRRTKPGPAPK